MLAHALTIGNAGPEVTSTNYWEGPFAARGLFFLSINGGAIRLLVPPAHAAAVADMKTAREVIVTTGRLGSKDDALELLFDDHSYGWDMFMQREEARRRVSRLVATFTLRGKIPGLLRVLTPERGEVFL